jgi:hypothetical protein
MLTAVILTVVMACVLLYLLLTDFSYDEDPEKYLSEREKTAITEKTVPMIPVQPVYTTDYEELEKLKDSEEEKSEYDWTRKKPEEEKDDNGDGQVLSRRQRRRRDKARQNKSY